MVEFGVLAFGEIGLVPGMGCSIALTRRWRWVEDEGMGRWVASSAVRTLSSLLDELSSLHCCLCPFPADPAVGNFDGWVWHPWSLLASTVEPTA